MLKLNPLLYCLLILFVASWKFSDTAEPPTKTCLELVENDVDENATDPEVFGFMKEPSKRELIKYEPSSGRWVELTENLPASRNCFLIAGEEFYVGGETGLFKASMDGDDLSFYKEPILNGPVFDIQTTEMGSVYISTLESGVLFRPDFTGFWIKAYPNLTKTTIFNIWEDKSGTVLVGGSKGIHMSKDNGKSWTHRWDGNHASGFAKVGKTYYAASGNGILASSDNGYTWNKDYELTGNVSVIKAEDKKAVAVIFVERDPKTYGPEERASSSIHLLNPNTKKWMDISRTLPDYKTINDAIILNDEIYCSTTAGVFKSKDNGKTWEMVLKSNDEVWAYSFRSYKGVLYMLKGFNGC
ncbi:MAG: hypothetical protein KDC49_22775 [Saprospiraceae bacterium]|nr:hypothetical protein [Saprospiraceae bacterium]